MMNQYNVYPRVGFIEAIKSGFKKYIIFWDRSRRSEFWFFALFNFLINLILIILLIVTAKRVKVKSYYYEYNYIKLNTFIQILIYLYTLVIFCPSIALSIRRLHDIGKSCTFLFLSLIPIVGGIIIIVYYCFDSLPEENEYGPSPKYYINEQNTIHEIPLVPCQSNNDIQLNVTPQQDNSQNNLQPQPNEIDPKNSQ